MKIGAAGRKKDVSSTVTAPLDDSTGDMQCPTSSRSPAKPSRRATQKAERYRLLNQSSAAESICLDVLEVDPANQQALVTLLLAITDQFVERAGRAARGARGRCCRGSPTSTSARTTRASSPSAARTRSSRSGAMHAEAMAATTLRAAMEWFEKAERLRPPGNDDAILRWNTCQRTLARMRRLEMAEEQYEPSFGGMTEG